MPRYQVGDQTIRRKNFYMPCIIGARVDEMTDEEYAEILKQTYWADNITKSEWPVVLRNGDAKPHNRSRLKKKAAGWLIALQRIALLHPELFEQIADRAQTMYREQVEDEPVVHLVWDGRMFEAGENLLVGTPVDWHPEESE